MPSKATRNCNHSVAVKTPRAPTRTSLLRWLQFYVKFLRASPNHQDRILKLLQWTAWLASVALQAQSRRSQQPHQRRSQSTSAVLAKKLAVFSTNLSFARYVTRLVELPLAVEAAWTGSWGTPYSTTPSRSILYDILGRWMAWSMIGYYPTEGMAYALWTLPQDEPNHDPRRAAKWSAASCACWLVYLGAEMVHCVTQLRDHALASTAIPSLTPHDVGTTTEMSTATTSHDTTGSNATVPCFASTSSPTTTSKPPGILLPSHQRHLQLQLLRDALFVLPCLHWSLPNWDTNPWLPTPVVHGLMWCESVVSLYQAVVMELAKEKKMA